MDCKTILASVIPLCLNGIAVQAEQATADSFAEVFTQGQAALDLRYRYENVDQDSLGRTASANTLRSRLTLSTARWSGFSALVEGDYVTDFGSDNYNSTENGNTDRPVIADIEGADLNQLWLRYSQEDLDAKGGRQRINHADQRFVGGVAWRQNEQTYDGVRVDWAGLQGLRLDAAYVYNVNRIFGPDDGVNPADLEGDNFFLRADWQVVEGHSVAAFGYWLDIDEDGPFAAGKTVNNSTDTYGLAYKGSLGFLQLGASWATQSEAGDSELDYDADYYRLELGSKFDLLDVRAGWEVLGGGDGVGFNTPYATLHKFQGWADVFLATPEDGVEDLYGSVTTSLGNWRLSAVYHDFQAEDSSEDFGTELDLSAQWILSKDLSLLLKYASFSSDTERYSDTDKLWFQVQFRI